MFFSLHSMTCSISSLGGIMSGGDFVLPKIGGAFVRGGFCPGGFCPGGFCPGGILSWTLPLQCQMPTTLRQEGSNVSLLGDPSSMTLKDKPDSIGQYNYKPKVNLSLVFSIQPDFIDF